MLLARCSASAPPPDPQVTLSQGPLRGKTLKSRKGRNILTFQGIPYAAPPVGNLRFKAPQEPRPWTGPRLARSEAPICAQMDFVTNELKGEEDCLYLNVYTPQMKREGAGLSVMVWVHGGGFFSGSGDTELYGPELLLDQDVVLVTFNYRVGVLGFLSLGTTEAPGNYGLKDQVAALQWVKKNISKFGGNPECVTIFGESAGGASIHYLMLSPLARGLFHRAICQSGSAHNDWAMERGAALQGQAAAARLGCKQLHPDAILSCLRGVDASRLAELDFEFRLEQQKLAIFVPTVEPPGTEGAFLTEDPRSMLARGDISDVPLMAGYMTHEGLMQYSTLTMKNKTVEEDLRSNFARYVPDQLQLDPKSAEYLAVLRKIYAFYEAYVPNDPAGKYVLMNSDAEFVVGVDDLVRGVAALRRSPVFYYQFSYDGGLGLLKKLFQLERSGTCHADELGYMFSRSMFPGELDAVSTADHQTIDRLTKLWSNFAHSGNPTPDAALGVRWEAVTAPLHGPKMADTRYLDIGAQLVMKNENLNAERIAFWQSLRDQHQAQIKIGKL